MDITDFITTYWLPICLGLYGIASEIIGMNPKWQSNTVVQIIMVGIGKLLGKK